MQTPQKQKENLSNNINKAAFVRAMAEMMITNFSNATIKAPAKYKDQVIEVKELLKSDTSGIVNSLLDFAITCALVDYSVETDNEALTELFNSWLSNINDDLRGLIPTGLNALSKEYFRERWKGSSFLLLRSIWEERDGFILPTKLWFVNGEDIVIDDKNLDSTVIGSEKYLLQINKKEQKVIPFGKDEKIFVQKPYESWGTTYPTPFLIRRGIYKNLKMLDALATKSEYVITKALEYLLLLKKGSEALAQNNNSDYTYSADELSAVKGKLEEIIRDRKSVAGTPTYAANFDTQLEHLIPDYDKALKQELYSPIERRILAGLGLIDVLQGVSSTRRESTLNPRPFITEVESGIKDFKSILGDVLETIVIFNRVKHPKYVGNIQKIHSTPISQFITDDVRNHFRSMYDKGVISKRTYIEVVGDMDYVVEYNRRKMETDDIKKVFYPPIIVNAEQYTNADDAPIDKNGNKIPDDKKGTEKKNFKAEVETAKEYEESPYKTIEDLPSNITDVLPKSAQKTWMKVFNDTYSKGEDYARKVAWTVIKKLYRKEGDKWVPKKKAKTSAGLIDINSSNVDALIAEVMKMKEIEIKDNQLKLLKKLNEETE